MPTLYVTEPGSRIEKDHQRLVVRSKEDDVLVAVPFSHVEQVVLVGYAGATTPALLALLDNEVDLLFLTRLGKVRGTLRNPEGNNIILRRKQYLSGMDPAFNLALSQGFISGKLRNSHTFALRILRGMRRKGEEPSEKDLADAGRIKRLARRVSTVNDQAELRGIEGDGARAYFSILRRGLRWREDAPAFERRQRRPPKDPVNAMLSLGYTLLTQSVFSALEVVGLDPYAGFFHTEKYGRPALALDLVEEFRPVIVDSLVLTLVNKGIIHPADFQTGDEGAVYLSRRGLRKFFQGYAARLYTHVFHPLAGRRLSYQKILEVQCHQVRKVVSGEAASYIPFYLK